VEVAPVQPNRPILGLFCGGTLAQEAALTLGESVQVIDFGDDQYTRGRAHPMIDPTLRNQAIAHASAGVVLLDFILGLSAHPDPVGAALPAIRSARDVAFVAHVVGTDLDPQGLAAQEDALRAAGVLVCPSNYAAAVAAANA
jgi:FdrA protein